MYFQRQRVVVCLLDGIEKLFSYSPTTLSIGLMRRPNDNGVGAMACRSFAERAWRSKCVDVIRDLSRCVNAYMFYAQTPSFYARDV
jgi:hypothetical protein